jgi:hypothetical protein
MGVILKNPAIRPSESIPTQPKKGKYGGTEARVCKLERTAATVNDLQLALVHPPRDGNHYEPEWIRDSRHLVT